MKNIKNFEGFEKKKGWTLMNKYSMLHNVWEKQILNGIFFQSREKEILQIGESYV